MGLKARTGVRLAGSSCWEAQITPRGSPSCPQTWHPGTEGGCVSSQPAKGTGAHI